MTIPAFFLGACLLLWGWQTENLIYAVPMLLVLESSTLINWRWQIDRKDFYRVADFSSLVLAVVVIYQFNRHAMHGVYFVLEWLPFVFFLLIFIQRYSQFDSIPYSAFFISMRKQPEEQQETGIQRIDFNIIYCLLTVLSASAGNQRTIGFFIAVCVLLGWILFMHRSRRYSIVTWLCMVLLVCVLGFMGQSGMRQIQRSMEHIIMSLLDEYFWQNRDPSRTTTSIGSLGRHKLSEHIRIRVDSEKKLPSPFLLREASYNYFNLGTWSTQKSEFTALDPTRLGHWDLVETPSSEIVNTVTISTRLRRDIGVVPMPYHSVSFSDPGTLELATSPLGAVRLEGKAGLINYRVKLATVIEDDRPSDNDLYVPEHYTKPIQKMMLEENLVSSDKQFAVKKIEAFFAEKFRYKLVERRSYPGKKPLMNFLLYEREGHCEYFATSTVLMLRAAGIPARYTIGYSIQEYSELEQRYVARARHSHAWASAFIDGSWQVIDTTPPSWDFLEQDQGSGLQPMMDLFSWLRFLYSELRHEEGAEEEIETSDQWLWLLLPLTLFLIWRLSRRKRLNDTLVTKDQLPTNQQGMDSEFFAVIQRLQERGYVLEEGESISQWLQRIRLSEADSSHLDTLLAILPLHYRYRFDPSGLSQAERRRLQHDCSRLL